jgi:hypothetical protein
MQMQMKQKDNLLQKKLNQGDVAQLILQATAHRTI